MNVLTHLNCSLKDEFLTLKRKEDFSLLKFCCNNVALAAEYPLDGLKRHLKKKIIVNNSNGDICLNNIDILK